MTTEKQKYETLVEVLQQYADDSKTGIVFVENFDCERYMSYTDLYKNSLRVLGYLQYIGLKSGDELVIQIDDPSNFLCLIWACMLGNIIPVPLSVSNNKEHVSKLLSVWKTLNNPSLVSMPDLFEKIEKYASEDNMEKLVPEMAAKRIDMNKLIQSEMNGQIIDASKNDIALIQFSSGSTGSPKGVVLTHENLIANIIGISKALDMTSDDVSLNWMPLTHDMGLIAFHLKNIYMGTKQVTIPTQVFIRKPFIWWEKANEHKASILYSPNFGYKYFLKFYKKERASHWDLSGVRAILNGAEPISTVLCNEFLCVMTEHKLKYNAMLTVYGLAEASVGVAIPEVDAPFESVYVDRNHLGIGDDVRYVKEDDEESISFVVVGKAIENTELRICDEFDKELADSKIGVIQIKGRNVMSRYYNNPVATARVVKDDAWVDTGDLGFIHNRELVITGRAKDVIFVNGQNYYAHDIERILEELPEIELGYTAACGVYSSETQQEEIVLFVLFKKKIDKFLPLMKDIKSLVQEKMGLAISRVIPVKRLNKTTSGKIQRYRMKERFLNKEFSDVEVRVGELLTEQRKAMIHQESLTATESVLLEMFKEIIGKQDVCKTDNFIEVGATSIMTTAFVEAVNSTYTNKLSITDLFAYTNVEELAKYLDTISDLQLSTLVFPSDFYVRKSSLNVENKTVKCSLNGATIENIQKFSQRTKHRSDSIFISSLMFILNNVLNINDVGINSVVSNNREMVSLSNQMYEYGSFENMVSSVDSQFDIKNDSKVMPFESIYDFKVNPRIKKVAPFYCRKEFDLVNERALKHTDVIFEMDENKDEITLACHYNSNKLETGKIEEFMFNYQRFIEQVFDN